MSKAEAPDVTDLLLAWRGGDESALASLMPIVYRRLKKMAAGYLRKERPDHTLQPTALVHEAYLRLVHLQEIHWKDRVHFLSVCARLMHRILVEHARYHGRVKRGSGGPKVSLETVGELPEPVAWEAVALAEALQALGEQDEEMAQVVLLRYFGGLNREEIGEVLGLSATTVKRRGRMAQAWLRRYLTRGPGER